jgi:hypothetical protein
MDATRLAPSLRAWALGTFHTIGFVVAIVLLAHAQGTLAASLARLSTASGATAFLALWVLTVCVTRAGLLTLDTGQADAWTGELIMRMIVAGGWNGVGILAAIVVLVLFHLATAAGGPQGVAVVPALVIVGTLGGALAFTIGGIVGCLFGVLDALLFRCGDALFRWASGEPPTEQRVDGVVS